MRWIKTERQQMILETLEAIVLEVTHIDANYYSTHRLANREEIVTVRRIVSHIASDRMWIGNQVIGDFFKKDRASVLYYIKTCQDFIDVDPFFAKMYREAREKFNAKLAEIGDNY